MFLLGVILTELCLYIITVYDKNIEGRVLQMMGNFHFELASIATSINLSNRSTILNKQVYGLHSKKSNSKENKY